MDDKYTNKICCRGRGCAQYRAIQLERDALLSESWDKRPAALSLPTGPIERNSVKESPGFDRIYTLVRRATTGMANLSVVPLTDTLTS